MGGWRKQVVGGLPLYQARTISSLPQIVQGFSTRAGGVSCSPYDTLNLGAHVGDLMPHVHANRRLVWMSLGISEDRVALAEQVHGDKVAVVTEGNPETPVPGADALVTNVPNLLLMLFFADCVPVYLVDPKRRAIGLAHAGWRGVAANIAGMTMQTLAEEYGSLPASCLAAIGPSIGSGSYEVGSDVADIFRALPSPQGDNVILPCSEINGTYHLNLRQVLFDQLLQAGVRAESIAVCDEDTYGNRRDFFSYRRDGVTGRMAALLAMKATSTI